MSDWKTILELVKREIVKNKNTGEHSAHYTSSNPNKKIVRSDIDGEPKEVRMTPEEIEKRKKSQVHGGNKQRGITKINKEMIKRKKEREESK